VEWTVSEAFLRKIMVTVIATGTEIFYITIDGPFQESPVLNMFFRTHSIAG
jgi:hypothetical protein